MPKSLENLKKEADTLGITYTPDVTATQLQALITAQQVPPSDDNAEEKTDEELKAESDAALEKLESKKNTGEQERMYTKSEMQLMIQEALRAMKKEDYDADRPEEHLKTAKTARLPRFKNQFVVAFKNMNDDEYINDVIYSFDLFDEKTRRDIAWVTMVFEDGTTLAQPLLTVLKSSKLIPCEIVEVISKDTSYKTGKISVLNDDGQPNGETVDGKVQQVSNRWKLKLPISGNIVEVGQEVLNW